MIRVALWALCLLAAACRDSSDSPSQTAAADPAPTPIAVTTTSPAPAPADAALPPKPAKSNTWTFVALSDLHLPHNAAAQVVTKNLVAALIEMKPRAVVITGDFTNGSPIGGVNKKAWPAVRAALEPLKAAGIPVLPIPGNHDTYGSAQKAAYLAAWTDLAAWAAPLEVHTTPQDKDLSIARGPFSYSVEIEGVHFTLAHIVGQNIDNKVGDWLKSDLAGAASAKARLVFGHVPMASVIAKPNKLFGKQFGTMLEDGKADFYISGHEHVVWDENVDLPSGKKLHQVLVGCSSGFYNFQPSKTSMTRAECVPITERAKQPAMRCKMPNTKGEFTLSIGRKGRMIQHYRNSFTLFTVDGGSVSVTPMSMDASGHPIPFYLPVSSIQLSFP